METKNGHSTSLIVFLVVAYGIAIAVGAFILFSGGFRTPFALPALLIMMSSPSLGAILATRLVDHKSLRVNGIAKGRLVHYLLGWAYPFVVTLIGLVLVSALGMATVSVDNLTKVMPTVPGISPSTLAVLTTVNLLLAPFINFIPALGEEYGWRGFLQPALMKRYGVMIGLTLTGLVWGLWHAPVILQGYNYPQHPNLIGVGFFTFWTILAGYFLGWLRIKSKSCFPAALGHGAINAYAGLGTIIAPTKDELLGLPLGLPGLLALALIAALVLHDIRDHDPSISKAGATSLL